MNLHGQHVLITGGSSGIGLALAKQCAGEGARVSIVARDRDKLVAAQAAIFAAAPECLPVAWESADVANQADALRALAKLEHAQGPVDVLITSAGMAIPGHFAEVPVEVFERTMAVNYLGTLYPVKALVPGMRARGRGAIVMISSGAGLIGLFGYTAYSPSKFAVRGLAESLRAELRGTGVRFAIVYPPDTDTPQLAEENRTKPDETRAITAGGGKWTADEVARETLSGLRRGTFAITPGLQLTALRWLHSVLAPALHWSFDWIAARARRTSSAVPPADE